MPLSGGGAIKSSGGSDLKNTPHIYVEAKRTEKFKIHESMRQVWKILKHLNQTQCRLS